MIELMKQWEKDVSKIYDVLARTRKAEKVLHILLKTGASLRKSIAEAEKKDLPVARVHTFIGCEWAVVQVFEEFEIEDSLYTKPQSLKPLTAEQIAEIIGNMKSVTPSRIARAIEAAHGIKE